MWVGLIVILHSALAGLLLGQPCPPPDTLEVTPPQDLWTVEYWNDWKGIELVTWNIEHFPMEGITTINSVAEVTLDMMSDIYALQEIDDSLAFKDQLMPLIHSYGYVLSTGSTNTNLAILYRKDVLVVTGTEELWEETSASPDDDDDYTNNALYYFAGRPPLKVDFQWGCGRRAVNFSVINVHLKCCDALERRRISAQLLRTYLLDRMAQGDSNMVVLGDWNDDLVDASPDDAFSAFLLDSTNFRFVTLPLAADTSDYYDSYPGWPSFLDHILISRGLFDEDQEASVTTFRLDDVMGDYYETILSDHRPVGWKFQVPAGASPYSVVINEIMQNPLAVSDPVGEWFELYSTDTGAIDLQGWTIRDEGLDQHVISSDEEIVLDPGAYLVMGRSGDGSINGGVETDYVYSSFTLGNGGDEIILLDEEGAEVDRVEYDGGPDFPDPAGASMALRDPISDNNVGSNWVESTVPYGDGDLGTPGGFNFPYVGPVWHVTVDGSDSSGDGSRESPFQSIQHGVDTAREGDTVLVHPGTYGETIRITGKDLVVTSLFQDSGDTSYISRTIIDGDGGGSVVTFEDGVGASTYLTGFTILNGHAERGGGIHISHSDPVITNCRIVDNQADHFGGGVYFKASSPTFRYSSILHNTITSGVVPAFSGAGMYGENGDALLVNSTVAGNSGSMAGGIGLDASRVTLVHCTVTGNMGYFSGTLYLVNGSTGRVVNSILWDNLPDQIYFADYGEPAVLTVGFSDIEGGLDGVETNGNGSVNWPDGNISVDPLFSDPDGDDFNLREGSPCIDAGVSFFAWDEDTLVNASAGEYVGLAPDMGAFEFGSVSTSRPLLPAAGEFVLGQNFPNPFNPTTVVPVDLPERSYVAAVVYDVLGRPVAVLSNGIQPPGSYRLVWNGTDLVGKPAAAGIYLVRVSVSPIPSYKTAGLTQTRKMVLLR